MENNATIMLEEGGMKHSVLFSHLGWSKPPFKHIHLIKNNGDDESMRLSTKKEF